MNVLCKLNPRTGILCPGAFTTNFRLGLDRPFSSRCGQVTTYPGPQVMSTLGIAVSPLSPTFSFALYPRSVQTSLWRYATTSVRNVEQRQVEVFTKRNYLTEYGLKLEAYFLTAYTICASSVRNPRIGKREDLQATSFLRIP